MTPDPKQKQRDRWCRNKRDERKRKAMPTPPEPSAEFVARARHEAEEFVLTAVAPSPSTMLEHMAGLREAGVEFDFVDLFNLWYGYRNDPLRHNRDIWRMSEKARDFTIEVCAARTLVEQGRGPGKATAGKIARHLKEQGRHQGYTDGSLRVMVARALSRIARIEAA